jgi:hypothetical protein
MFRVWNLVCRHKWRMCLQGVWEQDIKGVKLFGSKRQKFRRKQKFLSRIFHNFFLLIKHRGDDTEKDKVRGVHCRLQTDNKHPNTLVEKPTWMWGCGNGRLPIKNNIKINLRNCVVNKIITLQVSKSAGKFLTAWAVAGSSNTIFLNGVKCLQMFNKKIQ